MENQNYYQQVKLPAGDVHVYASPAIMAAMDYQVFEMANGNLQIPNIAYMSYTPDVHIGVGTCIGTTAIWNQADGMVSPSIVGSDIGCGMRVHLTNMHASELMDLKLRRRLVKAIEQRMPMEAHQRGHFSDICLEAVVKKGLHGLPNKYIPDSYTPKRSTSLTHVERAKFIFNEQALDVMPEQAIHRAHRQLGTLGGGNHFVEIQAISIAEEQRDVAEAWGLFDGQAVVMIHSGSRAWGAAVNQLCTSGMRQAMSRLGLGTSNSQLVFAPLDHPEGVLYTNLMYSALNYAVVNRHLIAFAVRDAMRDVLGNGCELRTLYDLMHNYATEEIGREGEELFVHRKGTTKALPAGHPDNPAPYTATGHPALIPGSMGTASYIMVGQPGGEANYYSICHGAGRIRSRSATKRMVSMAEFSKAMKVGTADEVVVNHKSLGGLIDESPQAYKDVDAIIESVTGAGLAAVVAKCRPLATLKGTK